ncbi:hypothetical protein M405DRAFT_811874 [Rhizopogon salebrosus TDB-379]|nr:hypothetical protein M405DRAFT_811874 [Rhizopogon salebrosus TDB-379]
MRTSSDKGPTLQERFPHEVSFLPDWTPFRALYFNLVPTLTTLATATGSTRSQCHPPLPPRAQSPRRVFPTPDISAPRRPCHIRHRAGTYLFQPEGRLECR